MRSAGSTTTGRAPAEVCPQRIRVPTTGCTSAPGAPGAIRVAGTGSTAPPTTPSSTTCSSSKSMPSVPPKRRGAARAAAAGARYLYHGIRCQASMPPRSLRACPAHTWQRAPCTRPPLDPGFCFAWRKESGPRNRPSVLLPMIGSSVTDLLLKLALGYQLTPKHFQKGHP